MLDFNVIDTFNNLEIIDITENIKNDLKELGWKHIVTFTEFSIILKEELGINCCMLEPIDENKFHREIELVSSILADKKSKECFEGFLNYCNNLDESGLPEIDLFP